MSRVQFAHITYVARSKNNCSISYVLIEGEIKIYKNIPKAIYLFDEGIDVSLSEIKDFIKHNFGRIKVYAVKLKKQVVCTNGLLLDFIETQKAFAALTYSKLKDTCHIILTQRLFATLDEQKQIHLRSAIFGFPSVISTSGIVEGPAKPKEFYIFKQRYTQLGIWDREEENIKRKFKNRFIDYEDRRMKEILKGYVAQGLFFYIMDEPFCEDKRCRLYNAHWQEDLIYAQIKIGKFCKLHQRLLGQFNKWSPPG